MRYHFLLDLNILHHAVRGVDEHDNPDPTAGELVLAVARICHRITISTTLLQEYYNRLQALRWVRPRFLDPLFFINQLIKNSSKRALEFDDPPQLPPGVVIPQEDVSLVRDALVSHPIIVTADEELREAITSQPALGLMALSPKEALEFVRKHPVNDGS